MCKYKMTYIVNIMLTRVSLPAVVLTVTSCIIKIVLIGY